MNSLWIKVSLACASVSLLCACSRERTRETASASQSPTTGEHPWTQAVLAARQEAARGSSPQEWVATFEAELANELHSVATAERLRHVEDEGQALLTPSSLLADPKYAANAADMYRKMLDLNLYPRIIGGHEDEEMLYPDCVAVGSQTNWCCSGVLVSTNVVVTAGHCDPRCTRRVFLGADVDDPAQGRIVSVTKVTPHPSYRQNAQRRIDLAVLILAEDVAPEVARPRPVAPGGVIDAARQIRAVGYGSTDRHGRLGYGKRRLVDCPVASANCSTVEAQTQYRCLADVEFVAGEKGFDKDTCKGDSGGPVYLHADGQWLLCGTTSRATAESTRTCGDGGIYVRVDKYMDWIRSVEGGHWR